MKKIIKAWAVIAKDDGFLPDLTHPAIGAFYHVCSKKGSADSFVNRANKESGSNYWMVVPCEITYEIKKRTSREEK